MSIAGKRRRTEVGDVDDGGPHTIYVEGLPYTSDEQAISAFFAPALAATDGSAGAKILSVRAPRWQDSGRLRGYAHVDFSSAAAAKAALALDGGEVGGRWLRVTAAKPPGAGAASSAATAGLQPPGCTTFFVKNLPYECTEAALLTAFVRFGAVASARLARWAHTGRLKGFGYVTFARGEDAAAAMAAAAVAPITLDGRALVLDWETGAPRASFRTADGRQFAKTNEAAAVPGARARADATETAAPVVQKAGAAATAVAAAAQVAEADGGEAVKVARRRKRKAHSGDKPHD